MSKKKYKSLYGWYIVLISALVGFILSAGFSQSSMTIPFLAKAAGMDQNALLAGDTVRTVGIITAMLVSGFIYRKIGAKFTVILSAFGAVPAVIMIPYVKSIMMFYILKFAQGLASIVFPIFLLIIMDWIDEKDHGVSTAVFTGIFYSGAGLGGTLSGYVIAGYGWIQSYWVLGVISLILIIFWLMTVKENKGVQRDAKEASHLSVHFKELVRKPIIWLLILSFLATTWSVQAISIDMPLYAASLGYGELDTGKILSGFSIGIIIACIFSGKVSDYLALRSKSKGSARVFVVMIGGIITIASVLALILADNTKFHVFYVVVLLFSFGASWGLGSFYSVLPEVLRTEELSIATGFIGGVGDAGMTLAPVMVGIVFGSNGYWRIGWSLCLLIAVVSIVACLTIMKKAISDFAG